jgi:hypothetical protein
MEKFYFLLDNDGAIASAFICETDETGEILYTPIKLNKEAPKSVAELEKLLSGNDYFISGPPTTFQGIPRENIGSPVGVFLKVTWGRGADWYSGVFYGSTGVGWKLNRPGLGRPYIIDFDNGDVTAVDKFLNPNSDDTPYPTPIPTPVPPIPFSYLPDLFPDEFPAQSGYYTLIPYDPLVLDLNHNGVIDTANIENGAYFDGGNDDFSEKMAWVSGGDGLLCIDKNNDKLIDSSELFGNSDVYGFDAQKFCG